MEADEAEPNDCEERGRSGVAVNSTDGGGGVGVGASCISECIDTAAAFELMVSGNSLGLLMAEEGIDDADGRGDVGAGQKGLTRDTARHSVAKPR